MGPRASERAEVRGKALWRVGPGRTQAQMSKCRKEQVDEIRGAIPLTAEIEQRMKSEAR